MSKSVVVISKRDKVCSFKGNGELWSRFKNDVAAKGLSICHVLEAFMQGWVEGQNPTITPVRPVTVNLTMQHVVQRPRRMRDLWQPKKELWPPSCEHADEFIKSTREVGCLDSKEFIPLKRCYECFRRRNML